MTLIWALEFCKLGWHGRWRRSFILVLLHLVCAGILAWSIHWPWWAVFGQLFVIYLSYETLWRTGTYTGFWTSPRWHVLSFLSSWPVEIGVIWNRSGLSWQSWPTWDTLGLLLGYSTLAASVPLVLWTDVVYETFKLPALRLRPAHWKPSLWRRLLGNP